jgi:hypothetical protein
MFSHIQVWTVVGLEGRRQATKKDADNRDGLAYSLPTHPPQKKKETKRKGRKMKMKIRKNRENTRDRDKDKEQQQPNYHAKGVVHNASIRVRLSTFSRVLLKL